MTAKPARWLWVAEVTSATKNGAAKAVAFPVKVSNFDALQDSSQLIEAGNLALYTLQENESTIW